MSESFQHQKLVESIVDYSKSIIPNDCFSLIQVDLPDFNGRPSMINEEYIPDVYYRYNQLIVIGEAKTINDFKTDHSRNQYISYFRELKQFVGEKYFVVAVPWELFVTAKNYFRRLRNSIEVDAKIIVITEHSVIGEV